MNKNIIIILLVFILPITIYYSITKDKLTTPPSIASSGPEIIKFASPMCYECQELEKVFKEVFPKFEKDITLTKIDVTKRDNNVNSLIKEYNVTLVPTTVFKNKAGKTVRRIEGSVQPKILENYIREIQE